MNIKMIKFKLIVLIYHQNKSFLITNIKSFLTLMQQQSENTVFIGTNSDYKQSQSVFHYNPNKQQAQSLLSCINPTYILCHKGWTYIVSEIEQGEVITLDKNNQLISRTSTLGSHPCHISVSENGMFLTVTNYSSGSVAMFLLEDNQPNKIRCFMTHQGHSINQQRQSSPHPHCSLFAQNDQILFVTDLGTDVVYYYSISEKQVKAQKEKSIKMPGTGPRTICKGRKDDKRLFLSCELDNTIRMLSYEQGFLELVVAYRISSNPQNFPSQICYWRNDIYIALRGDDKIMVFTDEKDKLSQKLAFKVGKWPRHFTITDYGVMYIACQREDRVYRYLFKEDKIMQIGQLTIPNPTVVAIVGDTEEEVKEQVKANVSSE